ncbi:transcription elongation factor [Actinoplanes sp. NPDC049118]|uniref:MOSC domain-containing protein n=1 Tax=Actinoplanes sp. NPDC049118 TaxID=3155769 RepID=UPI0033E77011
MSSNDVYSFTKPTRDEITLVAGLGVVGDVHAGVTVRHRSRVAADPTQPNLRQVHLIHAELHDEVRPEGYEVPAGGLGENITTTGLDLLDLPVGTILRFGPLPAGEATAATTAEPSNGTADPGGPPDGAGARVGSAGGVGVPVGGTDGGAVGTVSAGGAEVPVGGTDGGAVGTGSPGGAEVPVEGSDGPADRVGFADGAGVGPAGGAAAVVAAAAATKTEAAVASVVTVLAARIEAENAAGSPAGDGGIPRPAVIVTGLRNPCQQINTYRTGLLKHVLGRDSRGDLVRKAGVMAVVLHGGTIRPGDPISVDLPGSPHLPLDRV